MKRISLSERLYLPPEIKAIFWDMDGVLLDTLGLDYTVCNQLLGQYVGPEARVSQEFIRSIFAYHPPEFWERILKNIEENQGIHTTEVTFEKILAHYNQARNTARFEVNPGITDILTAGRQLALKMAVVSNNPTTDVKRILEQAGIVDTFDEIIGNDIKTLKKKPAPDTYLFAAERLGVSPTHAAVIEDSLVGAEAGFHAGSHTIGVATGGNDFAALEQSGLLKAVYTAFLPCRLNASFGSVTQKVIQTPNEFVSHMIEHIAWRTGLAIDLHWTNNDLHTLGTKLGKTLRGFTAKTASACCLGMIDDGSAEVTISLTEPAVFEYQGIPLLDLDWFMGLRCEQLSSGRPLLELIQGLAEGLAAKITLMICSVEDPHHSWEGIFRALGIALGRMFTPNLTRQTDSASSVASPNDCSAFGPGITIAMASSERAEVQRKTAESLTAVIVDFSGMHTHHFEFKTSASVTMEGFGELLKELADAAGATLDVRFEAEVLSSSHVVMEDVGLVLGRALKEILIRKMETCGINGAGCSLRQIEDLTTQSIRVGVSVEGRKFLKFVPFQEDHDQLKRHFIIGQKVCTNLFSEDLDDFLDGLAGGLSCSIILHIKELIDPDDGWRMLFRNLGSALKEAFEENPYRKGVPPGVKATLV